MMIWVITWGIVWAGSWYASQKLSEEWAALIKFALGVALSFGGVLSGVWWLNSAELALSDIAPSGVCPQGAVGCLSLKLNIWAAQCALVAAICASGLWNVDNLKRWRSTQSKKAPRAVASNSPGSETDVDQME
jgi:hypothetical protein